MKVFMLGWEFPPFISGGLGTACFGLTKAMDQLGLEVTFCLPKTVESQYAKHVNLLTPNSLTSTATTKINELINITFRTINSPLKPYLRPDVYQQRIEETVTQKHYVPQASNITERSEDTADYGGDMYSEIHRYAAVAAGLAMNEDFDIIHAHDWMTYLAGIAVAEISGKPLIVQVHSTEFDRSGEHVNQMIYDIERRGMHVADKIIAVSAFTRNIILDRYGISGEKVEVVHNGIERSGNNTLPSGTAGKDEKTVLFLGRITMQKGPEYFLQAAKKVLEVMDNVKFVMAGSGDMMQRAIEMAAELGIGSNVSFTGFLRGDDVQKAYEMADLFVMPSVSEPFGLVPLEALYNDVPVIISKQSGVSEVLTHALKVDFWDIEEMANKIVAALKYAALKITLQNHGNFEVRKLQWKDSAAKCERIYRKTMVAV
jgi:glycosyltransferase involved in cell wall biosynthesis